MTALRVLLLASYLPPRGGAEAHLADVARMLREHGHEVEVHAPRAEVGGLAGLRDRWRNPEVVELVGARLREFRPHVVHVHNFLRRLSPAPFPLATAAGVPTVLTVHDFQLTCPRTWALRADGRPCPRPALALCMLGNCRGGERGVAGRLVYAANTLRVRMAARVVRRHATRIHAPSQALALRLCHVLRREVVHLPHPFPPPVAADAVAAPPQALLFLGRVAAEKGVLTLVDALAALRRQGAAVPLTIAGDGPDLPAVRARTAALALDDLVRCVGWVDEAQVPRLFAEHGALVAPSHWQENSPIVVHQAFAAARPVLASARGGLCELVDDGATGFLFEPRDLASVTAALRRWRDLDGDGRAALARAARDRAARAGGELAYVRRLVSEYLAATTLGVRR